MAATTFAVTSDPQEITGLTNGQTYRAQNKGQTNAANDEYRLRSVPFLTMGSLASATTPTRATELFDYFPYEEATLRPIAAEKIWVWCHVEGATSTLVIEQTS